MLKLMADHDVEGHLDALLRIWKSDAWSDLWQDLHCEVESFQRLSIAHDISDADLWQLCQSQGIVLVTGNRNVAFTFPELDGRIPCNARSRSEIPS